MQKKISELLEEGRSRSAVFDELKDQVGNELRLAKKIATFRTRRETGFSLALNLTLVVFSIIQAGFAIWVIQRVFVPLDPEFALQGTIFVATLSVLYLIGLVRMAFTGYAAFLMFCIAVAANYIYGFQSIPIISVVGLLLASINGALALYLKIRLYPHMGFMDVRTDTQGRYIFE